MMTTAATGRTRLAARTTFALRTSSNVPRDTAFQWTASVTEAETATILVTNLGAPLGIQRASIALLKGSSAKTTSVSKNRISAMAKMTAEMDPMRTCKSARISSKLTLMPRLHQFISLFKTDIFVSAVKR